MKEKQAKIEERADHWPPIDLDVPLRKMKTARPDHERRRIIADNVDFARVRVDKTKAPERGVPQIDLPVQEVFPRRRGGVFEVGHKDARTGAEGINDHLAINRARYLDSPIEEVFRE